MQKVTKKDRRRIIFLFCIFIPLFIYFICNMTKYVVKIYGNIKEKQELQAKYEETLEEEYRLKSDIIKLQDDEYIARYAREKFLYSKDGELIIKIK